ncbi:glycosyltransferase family 4 protein [bacterium]|nr:glycosyltransferase family 4 protein [bacterium]
MDKKRKKCLFIYTSNGPFVMNDNTFLHRYFEVTEYHCKMEKSFFKLGWNLFKFSFFVVSHISRIDFVYTWFIDYHSLILTLLVQIFQKPLYSVVGGYEVEHLPHIKYGGLKNPIRKFAIQFSLNHTTKILVVSQYTFQQTKKMISHNRIEVVNNAIDLKNIKLGKIQKRGIKKYFLSVGNIDTDQRMKRKGIDRFIQVARHFPDEPFMLIGVSEKMKMQLSKNSPDNIILIPKVLYAELQKYYEQAMYYIQLSEVESFGMAVLEAMSYGAIPIISNRGALPEIFGDVSIVVDVDQFDNEIKTLKQKMESYSYNIKKIQKILNKYDLTIRYKRLKEILYPYIAV